MNVVDRLDLWIDGLLTASAGLVVRAGPPPGPPSQGTRNVFLAVAIIVVTGVAGWASLHWHTAFPLIVLGLAYGVLVSYPVMKLLRNRTSAQSWISGITGGVSLDNLVKFARHPETTVISDFGAAISKVVTAVAKALVGTDLSQFPYFRNGVIWGTWLAFVTVALIVIVNVATTPTPAPAPAAV
jgi:hypothetical protein